MKFATIIQKAGLNKDVFPKCSQIPVIVYDRKDRVYLAINLNFVMPLFEENRNSFIEFSHFLEKLEKDPPSTLDVKIDEASVVLFYKKPQEKVFSRIKSLDPIDYMD